MVTIQTPQKQDVKRNRPSALTITVVAVVVIVGLIERIVLLRHSSLQPDSDESMAGLMAQNLLRGNPETFLWGQPYGGAGETWPVALMIKIFGPTLFAMRAVTVALGAVFPILMWRVATRYMKPTGAIAAGATMWVWPVAFMTWSMREYLYYTPTLTLGLAGMLFAQRATEDTKRWVAPIGVGVCMGLGWWLSPFVAYFGIGVVLILLQSKRFLINRAWVTILGFLAGASGWLFYNVPRDLISLQTPPGATGGTYLEHLQYLAQPGLAVAFGLKGWYSKAWPFDNERTFGHGLLFVMAAIGAAVIIWAFIKWARQQERFPVDMACLVVWPFLYALSPMTGSDELWVPRYFFFLWPFMAFAIGRLVSQAKLLPVVMTAVLCLSAIGMNDQTKRVNDWPYTGELRAAVKANGVTHMFTSFWVAYKINYEMDGKVIANPALPASVRYEPYDIQVRQSTNPAWAFRHGDNREARL